MKTANLFLSLIIVGAAPLIGSASSYDALLVKLAGDDEVARAEARQLLPRESIEAVPGLIALLASEKTTVWRAAYNVLADFANEVSVPGREEDCRVVAGHLMTLVRPERPEHMKIRGLSLLTIAVPKGFDVAPMGALLGDAALRERARAALEEMGTPEARAALRSHLADAEPAFQCAILHSLGHLQDAESISAIEPLLKSSDAGVRASASLALAWTGDPRRIKAARQVVDAADDATRSDAMDALFRLLNATAEKGGNWQIVVGAYLELLPKLHGVHKDAVLAGLGRIGDGTCVGPVLAAIRDEGNPTRLVGIAALRAMQGVDVTRALAGAYPSLPDELKLALLPVLGEKKHKLAMPLLFQAAATKDAAVRRAGLLALAGSEQPEALALLTATLANGAEDEKLVARGGILTIADALRAHGKCAEAAPAYVAAAKHAGEESQLARALQGIASCPSPEAFDVVKAAAANRALREPAINALIAVGGALAAANQKEQALAAYKAARDLQPTVAQVQAIAKGMFALGEKVDLPDLLGTITRWWVVGPFELGEQNKGWDTDYITESSVSLSARYMSGKTRVNWNPVVSSDPNGKIDLRKTVANRDNCIGYAYTEIIVKEAVDALLQVGVDDSEKIWVNGEKVFELWVARGITPDQDKVPVKLKAGRNTILLKIWQNTLGWEFCVRVTTPDGRPIQFEQAP